MRCMHAAGLLVLELPSASTARCTIALAAVYRSFAGCWRGDHAETHVVVRKSALPLDSRDTSFGVQIDSRERETAGAVRVTQ